MSLSAPEMRMPKSHHAVQSSEYWAILGFHQGGVPFGTDKTRSDPRDARVFPSIPPDVVLQHLKQAYNGAEACSGLQQLHSGAERMGFNPLNI